MFDGYNSYSVTVDTKKNRLENYARGIPKGLIILSNGDPNYYYQGTIGSLACDVTNGAFYRKTTDTGSSGWVKLV
ncbi:hypothetical protein D3C73_1617160 [compost metagenome]